MAADAMIGVHRSQIGYSRRLILAGIRNPLLARRVRAQARGTLGALEDGLGGYAIRRA